MCSFDVGDQLSAVSAVISAVGTILTAVIAIVALRATARDSKDRSRPYVLPQFRLAEHSDMTIQLSIKNFGLTGARNLTVAFDPPFTAEARADGPVDTMARRYERPITMLPPGAELVNNWWGGSAAPGSQELVNRLRTPDQVTVTLDYDGEGRAHYSDTFELDIEVMRLYTDAESSTSGPGRMKTIAEGMTALAKEAPAIRRELRDISDRLPGSPEED